MTFANAAALTTTVTFAKAGTFVLQPDRARRCAAGHRRRDGDRDRGALGHDGARHPGGGRRRRRGGAAGQRVADRHRPSSSCVDGTTVQTVGLRFAGVAVPAGATITRAYVQFTADEVTSGTANLTVAGQAADNASAFQAVATNISSRPPTTATVGWAPARLDEARPNGAEQRTPDLAAVVQEIVVPAGLGARQRGRPRAHRQRDPHRGGVRARRRQGGGAAHRIPHVNGRSDPVDTCWNCLLTMA